MGRQDRFDLEPKLDHVPEGESFLLSENEPRREAILEALLTEVQELEDALQAIYDGYILANATDEQLRIWIRVLGEDSDLIPPVTDDALREVVSIIWGVNSSSGTTPQLLDILSTLANGVTTNFDLQQLFPARIRITLIGPQDIGHEFLFSLFKRAKVAGVALNYIYSNEDPANVKRFDTVGQGFDQGKFAGAFNTG